MEPPSRRELLWRWCLATGCYALLLFFFSPVFGAYRVWARAPEMTGMLEVRRGASVLWQIDHLGAVIPDPLHGAIQWRLLFPVIGHVLQLPPPVFFALAHVGCIAALGFALTVLRRTNLGWADGALATLILGASGWFLASVAWLGYFDSWLVLALLVVACARARWSIWLACVWAPWIDERFVLALPLALLCGHVYRTRGAAGERPAADWKRDWAIPFALVAAFAVVRLGLLAGQSGTNATAAGYLRGLHLGNTPVARIALGVWEGLRAGWGFVVLAVAFSWPRRALALALSAALAVVAVIGLATAQDFSRALMFMAPVALLGAVLAADARPRWLPLVLRVGAGATLLLPAHLVMSDRVNPVFYLYHELAGLQNPPAAAMPELYELRAIHAMEQGNFARAEADLTLAIKLSDHPSGPYKQRGVLYASSGRWADARRDFSAMVDCDPDNPESWFFRAQAELALGNAAAARTDLDRALERAPEGWDKRPDVARFLARLGKSP